MPIRQMPDGTYHAWTLMDDNGQEVSFSGYGADRGEALRNRDASVATGLKAYPGLKSLVPVVPAAAREQWDYSEARKPPAMCVTIIEWPDGKVSRRDDMDINDRDRRRAFFSAAIKAVEMGGDFHVYGDKVGK